jgi:hypothetical protein
MDHAPERDSSKRPAEQCHVKGGAGPHEALDRANTKLDVGRATRMLLENGFVDTGPIRVDGQDRRRSGRVLEGEPSVSAANLQDSFVSKAYEALDQPRLKAVLGICR